MIVGEWSCGGLHYRYTLHGDALSLSDKRSGTKLLLLLAQVQSLSTDVYQWSPLQGISPLERPISHPKHK